MSRINLWLRRAKSPTSIILILSLLLIIANLYVAQRTWSYSSDDVTWQTILMTWHPFGGHIADVGSKDNFVINAPLIWLFGHFFSPSRSLLFVEAALFASINFLLFYVSGIYILRRYNSNLTYVALIPFLWLASFGFNFSSLFLNTNWRNFEAGLSFVLFALAVKVYLDKTDLIGSWTARLLTLLTSLIVSILIFSDPYFLYFTVAPVVIMFMLLSALKRVPVKQVIIIVVAMMISLVVARVTERVMAFAGLFTPQTGSYQISGLHALMHTVSNVFSGLLTIFMANPLDIHRFNWATVIAIGNILLVVIMAVRLLYGLYRRLQARHKVYDERRKILILLASFLGALCVWVMLANMAYKADNYRYLLIIVYAFTLLLSLYLSAPDLRIWVRKTLIVLVVVVTIANIANTLTQLWEPVPAMGNASNYLLTAALEKQGLTKGYTGYWDGDINTYLSKGKVTFLPITCGNGQTNRSYLLMDATLFNQPARRTFYLINTPQSAWPTCTKEQAIAQFGKPQLTLMLAGRTVLVYNYDIVSKINVL